jgi:mannosyl-oligosaccharide alpha-1,2-mannosidase
MFQNIEGRSRTEYAHAAVTDVRTPAPSRSDEMESFWLAETLKYFYLIFSDGLVRCRLHFCRREATHP